MCALAGGSHDYWGGPGYDACRARIGPDFEDVFYKNNWAANVKMHSVYMWPRDHSLSTADRAVGSLRRKAAKLRVTHQTTGTPAATGCVGAAAAS